jgi:hypothetical protein
MAGTPPPWSRAISSWLDDGPIACQGCSNCILPKLFRLRLSTRRLRPSISCLCLSEKPDSCFAVNFNGKGHHAGSVSATILLLVRTDWRCDALPKESWQYVDSNILEPVSKTAQERYEELKAKGLKLDLTRGKPSSAQLDLSAELLALPGVGDYTADGADARNYGGLSRSLSATMRAWR